MIASAVPARVSVFYGYKGGSGRSFTLAHVASILAQGYQRRVLVVDADLEAPGVGDFFTRMPAVANPNFARVWRTAPGLLDAISAYGELQQFADLSERLGTDAFFSSSHIQHVLRDGRGRTGCVDLLGPGKLRSENYAGSVILQDWNDFYAYGGQLFFHSFANAMREHYDHVLFDVRAGFAASTAPAATAVADDLVIFANPSHQSIVGLENLVTWLDGERERIGALLGLKRMRHAAVLSRVEGNLAGGVAWEIFQEFFKSADKTLRIPHFADLQHEQIVTVDAKNRALVDELGDLAAWIAEEDDEAAANVATERAFPRSPDSTEPAKPSQQSDQGSVQKVTSLIEQARKLVDKPEQKPLPSPFLKERATDDARDGSATSATRPMLSASDLRNQYNQLFLLEAALWERLLKRLPPAMSQEIERQLDLTEDRSSPESAPSEQPADDEAERPVPTFNHSGFPARIVSHDDVRKLADDAGLRTAARAIAAWLDNEPDARGDRRASAALDLLRRAAFIEDGDLFEQARAELRIRAENFDELDPEQRWDVGYSLVFAGDALRQLGGRWFEDAHYFLRRGWQAGALFSPGNPPFPYEAVGILDYTFFLSTTGQVAAARKTLRNVYKAVKGHTRTSDVFKAIATNHRWWGAAFRLFGADTGAGVTDEIVDLGRTLDRNTLAPLDAVLLDSWLTVARRWRGELDEARASASRALNKHPTYHWLAEPPRLLRLALLLGRAQIEVLRGDRRALRAALDESEAWAASDSSVIATTLETHRLHMELMRGLSDDRRARSAVDTAVGIGRADRTRAYPLNMTDVRHRLPALVRACLTAVRIGHEDASELISDCQKFLDAESPLLENPWGDESRYLVNAAYERAGGTVRAVRLLDGAARRIARKDPAVRESARSTLVRLGEIWLERR
jgi:MinD-like ATPase involved in chromosome partitioning or flagellar assembly